MHRITSLTRSGTTASTSTTQAYRYRALLDGPGAWSDGDEQATLHDGFAPALEDAAPGPPDLDLTPALHIEPRLPSRPPSTPGSTTTAGSVVLPTGSGRRSSASKPSLTPASARVVTPTIDLMNQWHATLTNAFGERLPNRSASSAVAATTSPRSPSPPTTAPIGTSTSMATSSGYSSSMRNTTCQRRPTVKSLR